MRAWLACIRMSHTRASSAPPPIASPFKYASTGTGQVRTASSAARDFSALSIVADASRTEDSSTRSPPAAKNRYPHGTAGTLLHGDVLAWLHVVWSPSGCCVLMLRTDKFHDKNERSVFRT